MLGVHSAVTPEQEWALLAAGDDVPELLEELEDTDFEYTWENLVDVRNFYERAAAAGRAVIFTAT